MIVSMKRPERARQTQTADQGLPGTWGTGHG